MKDYTVIVASFERPSFFNMLVTAENPEDAMEKAKTLGEWETGIEYTDVLLCVEGAVNNLNGDTTSDWRKRSLSPDYGTRYHSFEEKT